MMYGDTAHDGSVYWLTRGAAQIPAWRNKLAMALAFPEIIFYGIALHLFYIMILYAFSWLSAGSYAEAALPLGEALFAHFSTGREKGMDINMKNTDTKQHLGDVQETALIPLAIRANETEGRTARIHEDKAVEIIRELDVDTEKLDQFFSHEGVIARTVMFDEASNSSSATLFSGRNSSL